jgi:hypothetical protein
MIDYRVTAPSLDSQAAPAAKPPSYEFAAAAFDADSRTLHGVNNAAGETSTTQEPNKPGVFPRAPTARRPGECRLAPHRGPRQNHEPYGHFRSAAPVGLRNFKPIRDLSPLTVCG